MLLKKTIIITDDRQNGVQRIQKNYNFVSRCTVYAQIAIAILEVDARYLTLTKTESKNEHLVCARAYVRDSTGVGVRICVYTRARARTYIYIHIYIHTHTRIRNYKILYTHAEGTRVRGLTGRGHGGGGNAKEYPIIDMQIVRGARLFICGTARRPRAEGLPGNSFAPLSFYISASTSSSPAAAVQFVSFSRNHCACAYAGTMALQPFPLCTRKTRTRHYTRPC